MINMLVAYLNEFLIKNHSGLNILYNFTGTMKRDQTLQKHLNPGEVYRRADLQIWSRSVDRDLQILVKNGTLEKLSGGLYYVPKETVFGKAPADERELVSAFLKDNRFVITSPNDYNALGVGTTQLYNTRRVYNRKRHGEFMLGNRKFDFVLKHYVPAAMTKEFLLVDLVNNLKQLAEDQPSLLENIKTRAKEMNKRRLKYLVSNLGTVRTKKLFAKMLD